MRSTLCYISRSIIWTS
ncbi:hypothetical protein LINGRAHAP2_LOCUS7290 [Linum grandiflorum]